MLFSQRNGIKKVDYALQLNIMSYELKNAIWNSLISWEDDVLQKKDDGEIYKKIYNCLWKYHLDMPLDEMPYYKNEIRNKLKTRYQMYKWHEVYDFVEAYYSQLNKKYLQRSFQKTVNLYIQDKSGYKFVYGLFIPITNESEIAIIEKCLNSPYQLVNEQIQKAINLLSLRQNPDYRNVIKESIGALETLANTIIDTESRTLSSIIVKVAKKTGLHKDLADSIKKFYDYTSDVARHGENAKNPSNIKQTDAVMALVVCSCYINYLISVYKT